MSARSRSVRKRTNGVRFFLERARMGREGGAREATAEERSVVQRGGAHRFPVSFRTEIMELPRCYSLTGPTIFLIR